MTQELFYPSEAAGEDIQQLLPKNIGLAFKMVWDAPADSPKALKQAIEKIARTRKGARGPKEEKDTDRDVVRGTLRLQWLSIARTLIHKNSAAFHNGYQVQTLICLIEAGKSTGSEHLVHLRTAITDLTLWWGIPSPSKKQQHSSFRCKKNQRARLTGTGGVCSLFWASLWVGTLYVPHGF